MRAYTGVTGLTTVERRYEKGGFDYLKVIVQYGKDYHSPDTFGGMSGGGLRYVPIEKLETGEICATAKLLAGVVFCESSRVEQRRILTAHGWDSIYQLTYEVIHK